MILGLAASLTVALIVIATDDGLRERLGTTYWVIGLSLIGAILLVLAGYVFDRTLIAKIKEINQQAASSARKSRFIRTTTSIAARRRTTRSRR